MKSFLSALLLSLFLLPVDIVFATKNVNGYLYQNDGTIEYTKQNNIYLKSNANSSDQAQIDFSNYNVEPPSECYDKQIVCEENTEITVITKKTWKPVTVQKITDSHLTAESFAKYFPALPENKSLSGGSPLAPRLVAQRILYERGLLSRVPTGKMGYETELAILKLQCLKGINEFDAKRQVVLIGPKTVKELNQLKESMKDPEYLKSHLLPPVDLSKCSQPLQKRAVQLAAAQQKAEAAAPVAGRQKTAPVSTIDALPLKPQFLKLEGEVLIKKR